MKSLWHSRTAHILTTALVTCFLWTSASLSAGEGANPERERELIAVLNSDAPAADKALACKHLTVHGTAASVPVLAKLLTDEQLASWARIPLEAIPGSEADKALRDATAAVKGRLLVGTINSIGVRRDADAVELLSTSLKDGDADVASAAAVALGLIGNEAASNVLRKTLASAPAKVRSAVAEGCILCAERFFAAGKSAEAAAIYDEVRKAEVPKQRILEATRGAILARKADAGIELLVEQLKSQDLRLFQIALSTAREFPGSAIDKTLADELAKAKPERAPLLIQAMADRKDTVILSAILKAASQGPKPVRLSAIDALSRVGDATCVAPLLTVALESDADLSGAAKTTLSELPGDSINNEIVSRLPKADTRLYPVLLDLVGQRRIDALPQLLNAVNHADSTVRSAALTALGSTVPAESLSVLIAKVVVPKHADDAPVAQAALKAACVRMPDRDVCAQDLTTALDHSPVDTKVVLLQILGAVGGTKALNTVGLAAKSNDPLLQDTSSKLLGEWMTIDAAPVLLDLAKTTTDGKYQVRAIRGYIRIARQFVMPDADRIDMCQKAWGACRQVGEQKLVVDVLKRYPTPETLKMAIKVSQDVPELKDDATEAALAIAQKVSSKGIDVTDLLSTLGLGKVKLEIVKAEYGSGATQKDVTETLQKQAAEVQLVSLPAATYNESFGGDPAPGQVKQLKVQYRINGKDSQASFAENTLIILPMPK